MKKLLNKLFDDMTLFKIIVIAIAIAFVLKLNDISKNGRYMPADGGAVIDTRTGNVFYLEDDKYGEYLKPFIPSSQRD